MNKLEQIIIDGIRQEAEQDKKRAAEQIAKSLAESQRYYNQPPTAPPAVLNPTNAPAELYCRQIPTTDERYIPVISCMPVRASKHQPAHTPTLSANEPAPHGYYVITITDRVRANLDPDSLPLAARARRPQHTPAPIILYYDGNNKIKSQYYEGYLRVITRLKKLNFQEITEHDEKTYLSKKSNQNKFLRSIEEENRRKERREKNGNESLDAPR